MISPGGVALVWPVGSPAAERVGTGLPAGWDIVIGWDQDYWLGVHSGLDINLPGEADFGQPVHAVAPGTVTWAGELAGTWGNAVLIHHSNVPGIGECWSQYAHLSAVDVRVGQVVAQDQQIGRCGNGATSGHGPTVSAHLHFEIRRQNVPAGHWPSGRGKLQTPAVHAEVRRIYLDPWGKLGA